MGGNCNKVNKQTNVIDQKSYNVQPNPQYPNQPIQNNHLPSNNSYNNTSTYYNCKFPIKNVFSNSILELKYIISNIHIKLVLSHSKLKKSLYVTEVTISDKKFALISNFGHVPKINEIFEIHKQFSFEQLENSFLKITVYEFEEMLENQQNIFKTQNSFQVLNNLLPKCKYFSYFEIDLLSFFYRPCICDFAMMGQTPLSKNARINFLCKIEHRTPVIIKVNIDSNKPYIKLLTLKNKSSCKSIQRSPTGEFIYNTTSLSISNLKHIDLLLESDDKDVDYSYISLNGLKSEIINKMGFETINKFLIYAKMKKNDENKTNINNKKENTDLNMDINNQINQIDNKAFKISTIFDVPSPRMLNNLTGKDNLTIYSTISVKNFNVSLSLGNLPIITQMKNLVFTEFGYRYNISIYYMINNDINIIEFFKGQGVIFNEAYANLLPFYTILININSDINDIMKSIEFLLKYLTKSVDNMAMYFYYQSFDDLNKMIIIFMSICSALVTILSKINDNNQILKILQLIKLITKRQELNNDCICYCIRKFPNENSPKIIFNNFYLNLLNLNSIFKSKQLKIDATPLIEMYAILYFKKLYIRQAILNAFNNIITPYESNEGNLFLYELKYDEELNNYLSDENKNFIINNILKKPDYFSNFTIGNHNKLLKFILSYQYIINTNAYPLDFIYFNDNKMILNYMKKYIKATPLVKLTSDFHDGIGYLTRSLISFNEINSVMITSTNAYDLKNIYSLFEYLKRIILYFERENKQYFLMDYSFLEKAMIILVQIDHIISLPKIFWLYYYVSHIMLRGNLKWFIKNICNKNFYSFSYHWSIKVRSIFFKMILFIMCNRIKSNEGKYFKDEVLNEFLKGQKPPTKFLYYDEAQKDFKAVYLEYQNWLKAAPKKNGVIEFPEMPLPYKKKEFIDRVKL